MVKMTSKEAREIHDITEDTWKGLSTHERGKLKRLAEWLKKEDFRCARCQKLVDKDDRFHFNGHCAPATAH